jgi:hypothetical protein
MTEPLIQPPENTAAKAFQDMADRIRHNAGQSFGGAFVVIPPVNNGGDPLETLILDSKQDPAQFWTLLKVKCDLAIGELDQRARNQQAGAFGRR